MILIAIGFVSLSWAEDIGSPAAKGKAIYQQKCASCHSLGEGRRVGPDLKGITKRRDKAWLKRFIAEPDKMLAEKDPVAVELLKEFNNIPMPNLNLSEEEVDAVLIYLKATSASQKEIPSSQPKKVSIEPKGAGRPDIGKKLFAGTLSLKYGGAPCINCHSAGHSVSLGGGTLGPDLTKFYNKFGDAGTTSVLATPLFPTMKPIYNKNPLTPEEQGHLKAFFIKIASETPSSITGRIILLILGGFFALMIFTGVLWRNRLKSVRKELVEQKSKKGAI